MNRLEPMHRQDARWRKNRAQGITPEPLRSLAELAEEFGISAIALGRIMANDAAAPAPKLFIARSLGGDKKKWFSPSETRRWWAARSAEKAARP